MSEPPPRDEGGLAQARRVTRQRSASARLSQAQLELAADAARLGLWSWDLRSGEVIWNARMHEISGQPKPLTFPQWVERVAHPDERAALTELGDALGGPGPLPATTSRIVRPDGQVRWVSTSGTVLAGPGGEPETVVGATMDVTETQHVRRRLAEAQRMETLGHLAAGVAHNFNNMLMVIGPCLEGLRDVVPAAEQQAVVDAHEASERAASIVRQLMGIAGQPGAASLHVYRIDEVVTAIARICRRALPADVRLSVQVNADDTLRCEEGALEQVLGNLILNARDALVQSGVETPEIFLSVESDLQFGERWTSIVVRDNGPGIEAEAIDHIFEPFFTTKAGKGSGLGLASCQAIVARHGGQLACKSEPGCTEFLLLLPSTQGSLAAPAGAAQPSAQPSPQPATEVMLVDDEPAIQRVVSAGLSRAGFVVRCASSRQEFEALLPEAGATAVVLLDRSLGRESGRDLLDVIRGALPAAKVLFFTGQYIEPEEAALVDGVVQKPVRHGALVEQLNGLLAAE